MKFEPGMYLESKFQIFYLNVVTNLNGFVFAFYLIFRLKKFIMSHKCFAKRNRITFSIHPYSFSYSSHCSISLVLEQHGTRNG